MIADAHCHAWWRWPYDTAAPDPEARGDVRALLYEMDRHGVDHAAVVCARIGGGAGGAGWPNEDNNDYVADAARAHPDRLSAWVDVDSSWRREYHTAGAADRLSIELERAGASGFTHYVTAENDGWLRTDEGREFFARAEAHGAVASLSMTAPWFSDLAAIANDHPRLTILLHHLTQPRLGTVNEDADVDALLPLAEHPGIGVKLSGFHYASSPGWETPHPPALALARRIHAVFGPDRLYWGSDFPAARDLVTYRQSLEVVRTHLADLGAEDLDAILGGNLARLLGLESVMPKD